MTNEPEHNPDFKIQAWQLKQRQAMPLDLKIAYSTKRIHNWYRHWHGEIYIAFSGGKDSLVLLHLTRSLYPNIPAVFFDTGLEYPEIREFVKQTPNLTILRPKKTFKQVLNEHGYPIISKRMANTLRKLQSKTISEKYRNKLMYGDEKGECGMLSKKYRYLLNAPFKISDYCCDVMKKNPATAYVRQTGRQPLIGTMAAESDMRTMEYLKHGCKLTHLKYPRAMPLSFWLESDIWDYIKKYKIPYCSIYDTGVKRTGCVFCMFGLQYDGEPNRFQILKKSHPKLYDYCINKLGIGEVLDFMGMKY